MPRGVKTLSLLFGFVVICALFWTFELPSAEHHRANTSAGLSPSIKTSYKASRNEEPLALLLQAPAPRHNIHGVDTSSSDPKGGRGEMTRNISLKPVKNLRDSLPSEKRHPVIIEETAINRPDSLAKVESEDFNERVIIEDAFNSVQLQPLPSDIDTNSNQVSQTGLEPFKWSEYFPRNSVKPLDCQFN